MTPEDDTTALSQNVRNQIPSSTASHPERTDTSCLFTCKMPKVFSGPYCYCHSPLLFHPEFQSFPHTYATEFTSYIIVTFFYCINGPAIFVVCQKTTTLLRYKLAKVALLTSIIFRVNKNCSYILIGNCLCECREVI